MNANDNIDAVAERLAARMLRECVSLREACRREGAVSETEYQALYYRLRKSGWRACMVLRRYPR